MAGEAVSSRPDVVLGFTAAWGFAPPDQTSPALAGAAGALMDTTTFRESVTELRIHGVSGSDGPTMLEHPHALQVAGNSVAGFYRRWSPDGAGKPSVPWQLEAYSWGGLTEAPLASASWLLLAPFMMYNVAYFMLPPARKHGDDAKVEADVRDKEPHLRRDRGHAIAHVLLRLLAMAATIQFVSSVATVLLSTVAWQAAGKKHSLLPSWMGWYGKWTAGPRVAVAMASAGLIVGALWWISVKTASKYESRTSTSRPALNGEWPLTQPGFWRGQTLVTRQRELHAAAALAALALIGALSLSHDDTARWSVAIPAAVVLGAAVVTVISQLADRYLVTVADGGRSDGSRAKWWCRGVLIAGLAVLVISAVMSGLTNVQAGRQPGALPGLTGFLGALLIVQAVLLIALAVTVKVLARQAPPVEPPPIAVEQGTGRPYSGGNLTTLIAVLGFSLGGLLTAVINFGVTRLLGTSEPSGFRFGTAPSDALAVPWPTYAFGAAPVGLLCGGIAAAIVLACRYKHHRNHFMKPTEPGYSPVAGAYAASTAGGRGAIGDRDEYSGNLKAIAKAWAVGRIADDAATAVTLAVSGCLLLVLAAEIALAIYTGTGPGGQPRSMSALWHGTASVVTLVVVAVAGGLVTLLRQAYSDPAKRKTIGMLWDVGTFWPRAVHPLAPPCYAERAVPEVVDRIRLLTGHFTTDPHDVAELKSEAGLPELEGAEQLPKDTRKLTVPPGKLLLTGYSQGSIIAPAVVAQLPPEVLPDLALLTLACPARRLYGRAFPAYFGQRQLMQLAGLLDAVPSEEMPDRLDLASARWRDLRRQSDYIGSWIFGEPESTMTPEYLYGHVDQPCLDPVVLVQDANPTPPPIHRHSQWWQDPRTNELGQYLVDWLSNGRPPREGR